MDPRFRTSLGTWALIAALTCCIAAIAATAPSPSRWPILVAASLCAGGLSILVWRRGDFGVTLVVGFALVFRLALVWLPPSLSDDAYRYVWDGYLQTQGVNPYEYRPDAEELVAYRDEAIYKELNSRSYYSVYPPISQLIFRSGALFYESGWRVSYYVIKGILAALEFGAVLLLARLFAPAVVLLYAWNPLVLIAGAGQAHGESAMVFFLVLTLWFARRGRGGAAALALACAGLVKLYPFVLFPLLWRRFGWRSAAVGLAGTAAFAMPYAHPHVLSNVLASLDLYVRLFEFNAGPYYLVKELFQFATGMDWSKQIGPSLRILFLALLPLVYVADWRLSWPLRRGFAVTVGAFLILSTTIHPWYLLGILVLVVGAPVVSWHWIWLSILSIGTYLLYIDGPYWVWVYLGWIGWICFAFIQYRRSILDYLLRFRAWGKSDLLAPLIPRGESVLDLGAAEGFVAQRLVRIRDVRAHLVDVVDMNRTRLPYHVYDGERLPYPDGAFDTVVLVYVLHHVERPEHVLQEAVRVSKRRVLVLESTFRRAWELRLLKGLDGMVNAIRAGGRMDLSLLHFRTLEGWTSLFEKLQIPLIARRDLGGFVHHRALFILDASKTILPKLSSRPNGPPEPESGDLGVGSRPTHLP